MSNSTPKPVSSLIDLSKDEQSPSSKPSAETQLATLKAIQAYNSALPKSRKVKDALPEVTASNVVATQRVKRDLKKKTLELVNNYKTVGIMEGTSCDNEADRYSLANRQREIQRSASQLKIAALRKSFENLIGA